MSDRMNETPTCMYWIYIWVGFFSYWASPKVEGLFFMNEKSQTGGQSCGSGPSLCICSRQAGSLTTAQHLEPSPVSFFQTIKCTSGLLLFGWPGDTVFGVSSVFLSPFLTSVVSFCVYGNPVDGCFLLKARQSVKLLLWKDSWQWLSLQNTFTRYWFLGQLLMLNYGNAVCQHCLRL